MTAPILITMGDPAGIGPEIALSAFAQAPATLDGCVVVGDMACLQRAADIVGCALVSVADLRDASIANALATHNTQLGRRPVLVWATPQLAEEPPLWGQIAAYAGRMAHDAIAQATQAALRGEAKAVVTAPIHKESFAQAGVRFPGHTEMLQHLAAKHLGIAPAEAAGRLPVRMMLASPHLRTVLHSIHVSLREAIDAVQAPALLQTFEVAHHSLAKLLGRAPRLAVAGLNPHAGEGGLFGREEIDHIIPAVQLARAAGMHVVGPVAPDTVFMRAFRHASWPGDREAEFDAVVALYHDQGLIPVKLLGVDHGVNVTLGLPLVRTSPDHGTAFDLAGTGKARPDSLIYAVSVARTMALPTPR